MLKTLKKFTQKKENICARTGCNNQVKRGNGTEYNYCSSSCQMSHYSPGSGELFDDILETPSYSSVPSSQWGVWTPNQDDAPPSYSSINNNNVDDDLFGSLDNIQVTPLWEAENEPSSNTSKSLYSSSSKPEDEFPVWLGSSVDPLWTSPSNKNSSRKYSPPFTPRSSSPSDEEEINCPRCTFFIRPNKTVCEMCGTSITKPEPKRSYKKSSSKPKTTISTYRDLYEEDEEEDDDDDEEDDDDYDDPFADPSPRQNNRSSHLSSDKYRNSRNQYSSYSNNYGNSSAQSRNQISSRNQSSSRSRTSSDYNSYQSPTPPSDELWIDEDILFEPIESTPNRRPSRQTRQPPPKPYSTPSFFKEPERRPKRNVQKPPTPPLKDKTVTCSACNFDNHLSMTHCEICYTQLGKTPPENKRTSVFNRMEETRAKRACTVCSYYNDADRVQCEMCYSPIAEAVRKSAFSLPSFFSHDVNMTQCPTCTFMNHPSMAQCEMCRTILPGNNIKLQQQQYQQIVENTPGPATKMFLLPVDDHDYMAVQQSFRVGIPNANILAILRVIMPARLIQAHEALKRQTAGNNPVVNVTHRMYHGTHVGCDAKRYYGPSGWKYCTTVNCGLCGISQNGNTRAKSRHGGRMWFAQSSGTSLGYCGGDPVKAIFVQDIISLTPPANGVLIVDKEAATLVKFLVIYQ